MDQAGRERLQSLVTRLSEGDRSAFHPAFDLLWPVLRQLAGRMLHSPADADDAAQQALLRVLSRSSEFDRRRDALSWILAIGANECRTIRRRIERRREGDPAALDGLADGRPGAEEAAIERDLARAAAALLDHLPPRDAEAILLAVSGRRRSRPDVSPSALRKRIERAFGRLRAAWKEKHGDT